MTKHEALKDLAAVVRVTPVPLPRFEVGPAPINTAKKYRNSNSTQPQAGGASLLAQLTPALTGGSSGGSLLDGLLGSLGGKSKSGGSLLSVALGEFSPVVSGLVNLFGGGGQSAPARLPLYSAPQRVKAQSGLQGGVVSGADANQTGMARANSTSSQPQVTLHINAMDTQSILNRSTDIAQAVRQAMLQSHPINDIVADL